MDYFPSIQNGYGAKKWMGFCNITVIDGVCLTYHPDALTYIVPPVTPCKYMEQQSTQLPPTECAETSAAHRNTNKTEQTQWNDF